MTLQRSSKVVDGLQVLKPASAETHPFYKKDAPVTEPTGSSHMKAYVYLKGHWQFHDFKPAKQFIKIGGSPKTADLVIPRGRNSEIKDIQVVMISTGSQWVVIDIGDSNLLYVNGVRKRQAIIPRESACVLNLEDVPIALLTRDEKPKNAEKEVISQNTKFFGVITDEASKQIPFDKPCLIGSNPFCDIRVPGSIFLGIIFSINKNLYAHTFTETEATVDGAPLEWTSLLNDESVLKIGPHAIKIAYPEDYKEYSGFCIVPEAFESRLCFQEILDDGAFGRQYPLPPPACSFYIGRSGDNYFTIDSLNVSRKHTQGFMYEHSLLLIDCGSKNGTYVNRERVEEKMVNPGDIIELGDKTFLLTYEG